MLGWTVTDMLSFCSVLEKCERSEDEEVDSDEQRHEFGQGLSCRPSELTESNLENVSRLQTTPPPLAVPHQQGSCLPR